MVNLRRDHHQEQRRNPTNESREDDRESKSLIKSTRHGKRWTCSKRNASIMLLCIISLVVISSLFLKRETQPLHTPPVFAVDLERSVLDLSEAAWQTMLSRFQYTMRNPAYDWIWSPAVVRGNKIFVVQQHAITLENDNRYQAFRGMIPRALKLAKVYEKTNGELKAINRKDIYLLDKRFHKMPIPLVLGLGDHKTCSGNPFPRFSWSTVLDPENCIAFALPTYTVYNDAPNKMQDYDSFHQERENKFPWSMKKQQAVWRGSASGHNPHGWSAMPRAQLVNFSIHYPELLDAAFTEANQYKQMYPEEWVKLVNNSRFGDWIGFHDFQKYRAVLDIDGNSWSDRFGNLLCTNSVVIKVQPANKNFFFDELKPWVHYIPVASNLSDLIDAVHFAISNETVSKVRLIVHSANEWCRKRVTKERFASDAFWMLNTYVRLLGTNETRWRQWRKVFKEFERNLTLVEPVFSM